LENLFTFKGRTTRPMYWISQLLYGTVYALMMIGLREGNDAMTYIGIIGVAIGFVPAVGIQVRRFHDLNKSGALVLINLIPYVGGWITLIMLGFMGPVNTLDNTNTYGVDPRSSVSE